MHITRMLTVLQRSPRYMDSTAPSDKVPVHPDSASCSSKGMCQEQLPVLSLSNAVQGWSMDTLRQYLLWVKATFHPELSAEAEEVLTGYYKLQRTAIDRTSARTTVRMLESLVRIAQAHAKLMARQTVTQQDAVVAVSVAEAASRVLGSGIQFIVGASFSDDPDAGYEEESQHLLEAIKQLHSDSE